MTLSHRELVAIVSSAFELIRQCNIVKPHVDEGGGLWLRDNAYEQEF